MDTESQSSSQQDHLWNALSDQTRRGILDLLGSGPRTTGDLAAAFPHLSRFAVMKHLGVLERAGLVLVRRSGRVRWNHLNAVPLREMYERWVSRLDDQWAGSMLAIGRLAETAEADRKGAHMSATSTADTRPRIRTLVEQEHRIAASPETVWDVLVYRRGDWQPQPFRVYEGDGVVECDPRPGGVIAETWEGGGFALWGTISIFRPKEIFEYSGHFGMGGALFLVRFELSPSDDGSVLQLSHRVFGDVEDNDVENYTNLWTECMGSLTSIAEGEKAT